MQITRIVVVILSLFAIAGVSVADREAEAAKAWPGREAEIEEAVRRFRDSGEAPIITRSQAIIYPYDESQPVVKCSPLRACDIELQAGEVITGVALGDGERWLTSPLQSGEADRPIPHVIVKPTEYNLTTNLIIGTTRRSYHLGLRSPSGSEIEDGELAYHRHITFYYPNEMVQEWADKEELRRHHEARGERATAAELSGLSLDRLNFGYRVKGRKKAPWAPTAVFDDGKQVYIRLSPKVRSSDLPALLVHAEGGGLALVNYRVKGLWYIVDGLFRRAELVVGVGKHKKKVKIINRRWPGE